MQLMTGRLADLRPVALVVQMAFFAHPPVQLRVRRHVSDIGRRPAPNNSNSVLNVLLVADVAIKLIVRTLFPSFPGGGHQMA